MFKGIPASPGIAIGKVFLFVEEEELPLYPRSLTKEEIKGELRRFHKALVKTKQEMLEAKTKVLRALGKEHSRLIDAHLVMLEDPLLTRDVTKKIVSHQLNAEWVVYEITEKVIKTLETIEDKYFRERKEDLLAVRHRIIHYLLGREKVTLSGLPTQSIVVAHNLTPTDTVGLKEEKVSGFATDVGGRTSHTALLAQSFEIPAVVGLKNITRYVKPGDTLIIDGSEGVVIINPDKETLESYQRLEARFIAEKEELQKLSKLPTLTRDGRRIELVANIETPDEIQLVLKYGAEGIGLYRTEFLYLNRADLPGEEEQYNNYSRIVKSMYPYSVIVRTLDLGGDKLATQVSASGEALISSERNPFLGLRSIRFCLHYPEIFKQQLSSILRASAEGKLKILFPMITRTDELYQAKNILEEVKMSLHQKGIPFDEKIEVGVLIEVPAAALIVDFIAKEVDFISIGTNDLIQYTLAVDRGNENVAELYEPLHPSILRLIKQIVDVGHSFGKWVGTCGEMAAEPPLALLLIGMGVDGLSVPPSIIPRIKKVINQFSSEEARNIANEILSLPNREMIEKTLSRVNITLEK